jgi:hypothetical protein
VKGMSEIEPNDKHDFFRPTIEDIEEKELNLDGATIDYAVEQYVSIRDNLRGLQKEWKDIEERIKFDLDKISMFLRDQAEKLGVDSFKTPHGTAYKALKESYRVGDWNAFIDFVKETDNYQLLERRVAKNAAREIHQTDGVVPPGLEYYSEFMFDVRRPTKEKGEKKHGN